METNNSAKRVLLLLLKDFSDVHTVTSIAKELKLSRVGAWKILKKLESDKMIKLVCIGKGKTSISTVKINWENVLVEKSLAVYLTEEALRQRRWRVNFGSLEEIADFLILYGSIINSPQEANDIDIIGVVSQKKKFVKIHTTIDKIQKVQNKKIHAINFTEAELKEELKKPNKAFVNAIKKGVVLFGQEKFIHFMQKVD